MITLYRLICTLSLWNTLYPLLVQVGPMSYYLKFYQTCGSKYNDHPVPFHYRSPCTHPLCFTLYSSVVKVGQMSSTGCPRELLTLFVNVLLFYRRLSKGSDYIHLKTYELSFNLSIHSSLKGPYNRSYEKNSFGNQNEKNTNFS